MGELHIALAVVMEILAIRICQRNGLNPFFWEDALASSKKIGRIGGMRVFHILLGMSCLLLTVSCSLVTVPVKTVGKVAETTVKTTGSVVEAPFKAVSGGYKKDESAPASAAAQQ
jgi:hypothetical protein